MRRVITILAILVIALSLLPLFGVGPAQAKPDATVTFVDNSTWNLNSSDYSLYSNEFNPLTNKGTLPDGTTATNAIHSLLP